MSRSRSWSVRRGRFWVLWWHLSSFLWFFLIIMVRPGVGWQVHLLFSSLLRASLMLPFCACLMMVHFWQFHSFSGWLLSSVKPSLLIPVHLRCVHFLHSSHSTEFWFSLQGLRHATHGYFCPVYALRCFLPSPFSSIRLMIFMILLAVFLVFVWSYFANISSLVIFVDSSLCIPGHCSKMCC